MSRAFSLVELSIVLVILGLLTGGILTGQSLIRAAELRAVTVEYSRYAAAIHSFRDKYSALPGDMAMATQFWGAVAGDASDNYTASCFTTPGTGGRTCNGNGNGKVDFSGSYSAPTFNEHFRFWQHLANAGMIEGQYTGTSGGSYYLLATDENSPASKLGPAIWVLNSVAGTSYSAHQFFTHANHHLIFGSPQAGAWNTKPPLKPEEAWNIDLKLDDGKPASGKVFASPPPSLCTNAGSATDKNASYQLDTASRICYMVFTDLF